tara:strand:- start:2001 stop:2618 length:618 start_codon:yes stop_codon:yes gene_type:complete
MSTKLLVDIDGVLLDWDTAFQKWMAMEGFIVKEGGDIEYKTHLRFVTNIQKEPIPEDKADWLVKIFNRSAWIGFLEPYKDSVEIVKALKDKGYTFTAITSLTTDKPAQALRNMNLAELFGEDTFKDIHYLETGGGKAEVLSKMGEGHWWIEDKPDNAVEGLNHGLKPILMEHSYNKGFFNSQIEKTQSWRNIYKIVTGEKYVINS